MSWGCRARRVKARSELAYDAHLMGACCYTDWWGWLCCHRAVLKGTLCTRAKVREWYVRLCEGWSGMETEAQLRVCVNDACGDDYSL